MQKLKKKAFWIQLAALTAFTIAAMSSSGSKQDAVDAIDGFTEGWQYGRSYSYISAPQDSINVVAGPAMAATETDNSNN